MLPAKWALAARLACNETVVDTWLVCSILPEGLLGSSTANKLVKCLPFSSGLFVSAGDRDNTGNVFGASVSRLLGNCSIRNSANCLMSSLTLKSATAFTVEGKIRQVMSLLYSFLKYRYVTGGKGEINSLVLTSNTILNVVVSLMQFIK